MRLLMIAILICSTVHADGIFRATAPKQDRDVIQKVTDRSTCSPEKKPILYVTSAPFNCPPCRQLEADIDAGFFKGIEIKKAPSWPGMNGYPSVRFQDSSGQWKSVTGYDSSTRDFLIRTLLPAKVPENSSISSAPSTTRQMTHSEMRKIHDQIHNIQSGRNTTWSWTGDLKQHLRDVHGVSTELEIKK